MNIAFRIDIGNLIGTGHYYRMSALADAFTELKHNCFFFKSEDEPVDYSLYDIVVIDTYQVDDAYISGIKSLSRLTVCYDDNAQYTYDCDVLLNANLHANELEFRFGPHLPRLLLGGRYALLRREFRESDVINIREQANRVFICFGGSDVMNMTPRVIQALKTLKGVSLSVILGGYTKNDNEVLNLLDETVTVYKTPDKISNILRECDVAITASGSMIYELAVVGMPSIIIAQADNQLLIYEYAKREGIAICSGTMSSFDVDLIAKETSNLLVNYNKRKTLSDKIKKKVDKNGAINAAVEIIKCYEMVCNNK